MLIMACIADILILFPSTTETEEAAMKTSEFIRNAVDQYLSPEYGTDIYQLCVVINTYERDCDSGDAADCGFKARAAIKEQLSNQLTMSSAYALVFPAEEYENYRQDAQAIRFMYADFLAHYFESEGD